MRILSCLLVILSLAACNKPSPKVLVVGTITGPETELIETAKKLAKDKYDLDMKIVEFNDYNLPNIALQDGSVDVNVYQHLPYLKAAMLAHKYDLQEVGRTFVYPMGIYSKKYTSLTEIPDRSIIAIPNDPSNEMRAYQLLEKSHLITLKNTPSNGFPEIESNPKNLQFKQMDAAQLARALPDVAAAVINTTFALPAGLKPSRDALFLEDKNSPYANIIVIKRDTPKKMQVELFIKALNSEEVKEKAKTLFGDAAIPAW